MAHVCEYETVKLVGATLNIAIDGVGVTLGIGLGTRSGVGAGKGTSMATGDTCEAGCDDPALGVTLTLLQGCIAIHPINNGAFCASIDREGFISPCAT